MSGYLSQAAMRQALQVVTATASTTNTPSNSMTRSYLMKLWQQQGLSLLSSYLPVAYLNAFAAQVRADTTGSWLTGLIDGRTDVTGSTYLTLLTADPGRNAESATLAALEVTAAGYSRQPVTFSPASSAAGGGAGITNSAPLFFGPFTASSGMGAVATHVALTNVPTGTGGRMVAAWALDAPVSASQNETVVLAAGGLAVGLDSWQS